MANYKYIVASEDFYSVDFFDTFEEAVEYCASEVDCGDVAHIYELAHQWKFTIPKPTPQIEEIF